ncbi:DUF6795 domain-containing protein [Photobacterium atrarenae]|uniref:DUF6795 domain-containing protein n=1 Tax=Photobacterium atrarenae TaxID=865757 RepID=A0ABY5GEP2_9GAMM|nr:DUF6795 domain-containing protein [Photobacterium atrarenae]UTV27570.1 hypothetical protein NNL38_14920 [Photobacterium atrarenae]
MAINIGGSELFKKETYELSPEISGKLLNNGNPYSHHRVTLLIGALGDVEELNTITAVDGTFHFPKINKEKLFKPGMFDQEMVSIAITAGEERQYKIWRSFLFGYKTPKFVKENLQKLECDINSDIKYFIFKSETGNPDGDEIHSICNLTGFIESGKIDI